MNRNIEIKGNVDDIFFLEYESVITGKGGLSIHNSGTDNKLEIGRNVVFDNFNIRLSCNTKIVIGDNCRLTGTVIMKITDNNTLIIGNNTTVGGANFICGEGSSIVIGNDCMIAWGIEFRTTDSHGIFDLDSKERVNIARDIVLDDLVWVGAHSTVIKGARIARGSVIAIKSVVSSSFDKENIIVGGIPAKIIKENIYWERKLLG
mgnify:CR=1 FL=1